MESVARWLRSTLMDRDPHPRRCIMNANACYSPSLAWQRAGLDADIDPRNTPRRIMCVVERDIDGPGPFAPTQHVAGTFVHLGPSMNAGPLARWNPALAGGAGAWENFGQASGGAAIVHTLISYDPDGAGPEASVLCAAGDFDSVNFGASSAAGAIAAWDGTAWTTLGFSAGVAVVSDLAVFDPDGPGPLVPRLIAAGDFVHSTPQGNARDIAQFDGATWSPLGSGNFTGQANPNLPVKINALAVFDDDGQGPLAPALYAAGNFLQWTGGSVVLCRGLARWDGAAAITASLAPPIGLNGVTQAGAVGNDLAVFDFDGPAGTARESLFIAGEFTVSGTSSQAIARWDGATLASLGDGLSNAPYNVASWPRAADLQVFDDDDAGPNPPALFVSGTFLKSGPHSAWAFAQWGCDDASPPPPCPGDANGDRAVNFSDITSVLTNWLTSGPDGDADHNGAVNFSDVTAVLTAFLSDCP